MLKNWRWGGDKVGRHNVIRWQVPKQFVQQNACERSPFSET